MRISDWSSDVCSSDLVAIIGVGAVAIVVGGVRDAGGAAAVVIAVAAVALLRGAIAIEGILAARQQIGRASCRERVCQYGVDLGGRSIITKKTNRIDTRHPEVITTN